MALTSTETRNELMKALSLAQGEFKVAIKNKFNSFHKSHYADLSSLQTATREALRKYELAISFSTQEVFQQDKWICTLLVTTLAHGPSGQLITSQKRVKPEKETPQGEGSALTYAKRQQYSCILAIEGEEDDDANAAEGIPSQASSPVSQKPSQTLPNAPGLKNASKPLDSPTEKIDLLRRAKGWPADAVVEWIKLKFTKARVNMLEPDQLALLIKEIETVPYTLALVNARKEQLELVPKGMMSSLDEPLDFEGAPA